MAKVLMAVKVEADMKAKVELIAQKSSLSSPDIIKMALLEFIQKFEKANGRIKPEEINQILLFNKKD
jgi:predicted transcriptional regulator